MLAPDRVAIEDNYSRILPRNFLKSSSLHWKKFSIECPEKCIQMVPNFKIGTIDMILVASPEIEVDSHESR